jgi:hypothetical protein
MKVFKGLIVGCLLSIPLWALIALLVYGIVKAVRG